jgi:1-deoxy-D-xylulose-5-phosphate reductoisomerase
VDSALLVNKGFELIEAQHLFALGWEQLEAVLHPQTIVHALAAFVDGSTVVQAAAADMKIPIQLALSWPERWELAPPLPATALARLDIAPIAAGQHPAFDLACAAGRAGGTAPCALNAADEVAVQAFLDGAIALGDVPEVLARVLEAHRVEPVQSVEQLRQVDAAAREAARAAIAAGAWR